MARKATTTPASAGVNAPAHLAAVRRAPAASGGDAPQRRAVRRRFLLEAGATLALSLGATAAVLAPDPTWGAPAADPDAELIRLCQAAVDNSLQFLSLSQDTADLRLPRPANVERKFAKLVERTWEARETISAIPAHTLAGARAKAAALRADWIPGTVGRDMAIADSLLDDLLRLLPAEGCRA